MTAFFYLLEKYGLESTDHQERKACGARTKGRDQWKESEVQVGPNGNPLDREE